MSPRLDVFLESAGEFDREAVEAVFAANGIAGDDALVSTADGGSASATLEDDSCGFLIERLTPEVARIVFDVARAARLAILPVDGSPVAIAVGATRLPDDELESLRVRTPGEVYDALRQSFARLEEMRGARSA
jgi:hypothetical protein